MTSYLTSGLVSRFSQKASLIPSFRFPFSSFSSCSVAFTQKPDQNDKKDTETKIVPQTVSSQHIHEDFKHEKKSEDSTNKEFRLSSSSMSSDVKNLIKGVDTEVQRIQYEPAYEVDNLTEDELPLEIIDISDQTDENGQEKYMVKIKAPGEDIEAIIGIHDNFYCKEGYESERDEDYKPMIVTIDKGDGCRLRVDGCWEYPGKIYVNRMKTTSYPEESLDDFEAKLFDPKCSEFNDAVKDFLAAKGINRSMFDRLVECVERKRYLAWLESVKDFVGN